MYQLSYSTHTHRLFVIRYGGDHMYVTSILHVLVVNNLNKFQMNVKIYALSKKQAFPIIVKYISTDLV